ncbi:MAG: hypothetical protein AMJ54_07460 [Deltaproteobacteria bacterium SG8_13]|nr:MAG: hypothetical protein AMJ54_07460 [Deltaproteobacteria bacterium SG8_13]
MLTGIHLLLTYTCLFECDHCFLYCGPRAEGTFTARQMEKVLDEAVKIHTVKWIYLEGGEPFLFYPLMLEGIRRAQQRGFHTGIVTNAYWATSFEDAVLWLQPLKELDVTELSISDDVFHYGEDQDNPAKNALAAARKLQLPAGEICIESPTVRKHGDPSGVKGRPVVGGGVRFRGRAADKLTADLPTTDWKKLRQCPDEDIADPGRVHIDAYGNVHLCQGLCIGNCWQTPLSEIVAKYDPNRHPVCGPLMRGGPAAVVTELGTQHEKKYVDECHLCYHSRRQLIERFPDCLGPRQVYGFCDE